MNITLNGEVATTAATTVEELVAEVGAPADGTAAPTAPRTTSALPCASANSST